MAKTPAERAKDFRDRKRASKPPKQPAKTNRQRCREYRARLKALRANLRGVSKDNISEIGEIRESSGEIPKAVSTQRRSQDYRQKKAVLRMDAQPSTSRFDAAHLSMDTSVSIDTPYTEFNAHRNVHREFKKKFTDNPFGFACYLCDRLWFRSDLKCPNQNFEELLKTIDPDVDLTSVVICKCCNQSLSRKRIPNLAKFNGFKYPEMPPNLPPLDLMSERLISPRIPFMQIRRLRHAHGQYGILGQIINVPICVNTMVQQLPRNIDDDHCINVHIKKKLIHKSSYLSGLVNKRCIKAWLEYLITTPLYLFYDITIDESFFIQGNVTVTIPRDEMSEDIPLEDSLTALQHTLLWNEEKYLRSAPGETTVPHSLLFDEHAEELSFPGIYLGQFRTFKEDVRVTPFMMATSELRRSDRRGVTPYHLLYMAMKIMRLRVRDLLTVAFKDVGKDTKITRQQIESEDYVNQCIESDLAFLRCLPNSTWYWAEQKKNLFAMIRQLGKPTMFLTLSANEIGWIPLLQTIYKLKNNGATISEEDAAGLHYVLKSTLINEDAVTCAIYFNKLVNVLMTILQSKKYNPFGEYRVLHYFKRIEFQHHGSPQAHILLWLDNAPPDPLGANKQDAISLIDKLISVSSKEASGHIKLQTHKHTFTCFKKIVANRAQKCKFEAPFMPCRSTIILTPMEKTEPEFAKHWTHYKRIRANLETTDYEDMDSFYNKNQITSDQHYEQILRAGITRPKVFLKRKTSEKWHNAFNPFIFHILQSNIDFQFILDEYSCAAYVVEYVNKSDRGISNLQRHIIKIMDENPEFDIVEITRKMSVDLLNTVEITSQEAAWYLLREPMSKSSCVVAYIPTVWPIERQRIRKTMQELEGMDVDDDSTYIWKENWYDKYQNRPKDLEDVTLAQFVAYYTLNSNQVYVRRQQSRIIRYHNYDMAKDFNEYKREMVTLHLPFRNEDTQILDEMKWIGLYDDNENLILQRRKEIESNLDLQKTIKICRELCREDEDMEQDEEHDLPGRVPEPESFEEVYNNPNAEMNDELRLAALKKLGDIACLKINKNIDVPNSDSVVQFKRDNVRNGGVAIYQKSNNATVVLTPNTDITLQQTTSLSVNAADVGEICAARCLLDNGQIIMTVVVYISPNQSIPKIMQFIHEVLALYTHDVAATVNVDYDKMPMIMSGDFNLNFAAPEAKPLLQFLESKLSLTMNNDLALSTTKSGTTNDAVFSRYLNKLQSTVYMSHLS